MSWPFRDRQSGNGWGRPARGHPGLVQRRFRGCGSERDRQHQRGFHQLSLRQEQGLRREDMLAGVKGVRDGKYADRPDHREVARADDGQGALSERDGEGGPIRSADGLPRLGSAFAPAQQRTGAS